MNIRQKVNISFLLFALLVGVLGILGYYNMRETERQVDVIIQESEGLLILRDMKEQIIEGIEEALAYLRLGDPLEKERFYRNLEGFDISSASFEEIGSFHHVGQEEEDELFKKITASRQALAIASGNMFESYERNGTVDLKYSSLLDGERHKFVALIDRFSEIKGEEVAVAQGKIRLMIGDAEKITVIFVSVAVVLALGLGLFLSRCILIPINKSLQEREVLLKELNHRVKNNFQIISSLLSLQAREIHDERAAKAFSVTSDRIRAMALIHEKLYESADLAHIDIGGYLGSLADYLLISCGSRQIDINVKADNILLGTNVAISCGVIANELVTNALKHAFPANPTSEITIGFRLADNQYTLVVRDNGIGFPADLDINNSSSLGLNIVTALARQLGGTVDLHRNDGAEIRVTFPAP